MRIAVTGATGVIGRRAIAAMLERGDQVVALTRNVESGRKALGGDVELHAWPDPKHTPPPTAALERSDAVLHLLGEPIAQRWSDDAKREIRDSRVLSTRSLVAAIAALPEDRRPRVLVSQSATGYYGPRGDEPVRESDAAGDDFLAGVTVEWEHEAGQTASAGVRVATTRTGVVLSPAGGALEKMLPPFKLGVGGPVAGGRQYVPWIHLDDVVGAMLRCLDDDAATGPVNLTAPNPVTNAELSKTLGRVLHRPAVLPVPGLALKALYGEMATIVLTGQRAVPARLGDLGYEFRHPQLEPALRDVLSGS
ncbi:MAG: TIGR01777 family oxidoreductase [Solirubrobacteraceae bacterium]